MFFGDPLALVVGLVVFIVLLIIARKHLEILILASVAIAVLQWVIFFYGTNLSLC